MKVKNLRNRYLLRLVPGEELLSTLAAFVRQERMRSGWLTGLGAVDEVTLGSYDLKSQSYVRRRIRGDCELVCLMGNIAWCAKEPVSHLHAVVADSNQRVFGGHLFSARCCVTVEILLMPFSTRIERAFDTATGLNLLEL